jgi:hypothetical protein
MPRNRIIFRAGLDDRDAWQQKQSAEPAFAHASQRDQDQVRRGRNQPGNGPDKSQGRRRAVPSDRTRAALIEAVRNVKRRRRDERVRNQERQQAREHPHIRGLDQSQWGVLNQQRA